MGAQLGGCKIYLFYKAGQIAPALCVGHKDLLGCVIDTIIQTKETSSLFCCWEISLLYCWRWLKVHIVDNIRGQAIVEVFIMVAQLLLGK